MSSLEFNKEVGFSSPIVYSLPLPPRNSPFRKALRYKILRSVSKRVSSNPLLTDLSPVPVISSTRHISSLSFKDSNLESPESPERKLQSPLSISSSQSSPNQLDANASFSPSTNFIFHNQSSPRNTFQKSISSPNNPSSHSSSKRNEQLGLVDELCQKEDEILRKIDSLRQRKHYLFQLFRQVIDEEPPTFSEETDSHPKDSADPSSYNNESFSRNIKSSAVSSPASTVNEEIAERKLELHRESSPESSSGEVDLEMEQGNDNEAEIDVEGGDNYLEMDREEGEHEEEEKKEFVYKKELGERIAHQLSEVRRSYNERDTETEEGEERSVSNDSSEQKQRVSSESSETGSLPSVSRREGFINESNDRDQRRYSERYSHRTGGGSRQPNFMRFHPPYRPPRYHYDYNGRYQHNVDYDFPAKKRRRMGEMEGMNAVFPNSVMGSTKAPRYYEEPQLTSSSYYSRHEPAMSFGGGVGSGSSSKSGPVEVGGGYRNSSNRYYHHYRGHPAPTLSPPHNSFSFAPQSRGRNICYPSQQSFYNRDFRPPQAYHSRQSFPSSRMANSRHHFA